MKEEKGRAGRGKDVELRVGYLEPVAHLKETGGSREVPKG